MCIVKLCTMMLSSSLDHSELLLPAELKLIRGVSLSTVCEPGAGVAKPAFSQAANSAKFPFKSTTSDVRAGSLKEGPKHDTTCAYSICYITLLQACVERDRKTI
jgi:hypothetical protein